MSLSEKDNYDNDIWKVSALNMIKRQRRLVKYWQQNDLRIYFLVLLKKKSLRTADNFYDVQSTFSLFLTECL